MVKLRNEEVKAAIEALAALGSTKAARRKAAFKIARVTRAAQAQLGDWERVENEQLRQFVKEYEIAVDAATGAINTESIDTPEKRVAWGALFSELAVAEYEYTETFVYDDFTDDVTPDTLVKLGPLVDLAIAEEPEA